MPPPLIFLGPSLPRPEAVTLCAGEYHPPIARGDLTRLAGPMPRAIVIVDGCFEQQRAVSPKEILACLDAGHAVFGAASIGALRAVELEPFGMVGEGAIAAAFRSGRLAADDEVAVTFDPDTLAPLSEPLACIRVALTEARAAGLLTAAEHDRLVAVAAALHYRDRSYRRVLAGSGLAPARQARLVAFCTHEATDQKAADARAVLRRVAAGWSSPAPVARDLPLRSGPPRPGPRLAGLPPAPKQGDGDSVRTVAPETTDRALDRVGPLAGITRVADVTGLDVLGVPNAIAVRPSRDRDCNSVYSGKALRLLDARVGARMEALEMACALDDRVPLERAAYRDLVRSGRRAVHPDDLIPLSDAPADLTAVPFDWVTGWDVVDGGAVRVPADAVFFRRRAAATTWKVSSNGLASGNVLAEALAHGLAEVIERDAETMFRLATEYARFPALLRMVAGPRRVAPPAGALPPPRDFPFIKLATLAPPLRELVARFRSRGVRVALRCITSDVAVPVMLCALWEPTTDGRRHLVQYGCGAHPDARIAARRAITEAAQSRGTAIQGAREDLEAPAAAVSDPPPEWFDGAIGGVDFDDLPRAAHADVRDDIAFMVDALARAELRQVLAVDLSNTALEFPVLKVVVPGLELAFHAVDPARIPFGWRARRYFDAAPAAPTVGAPARALVSV